MLMPKRVKYRKQMRGRMRGKALRGAEVSLWRLRSAGAGAWLGFSPTDRSSPPGTGACYEAAAASCGSAFSLTSRIPTVLLKPVWVKVKAQLSTGLLWSNLAGSCWKLVVCRKISQLKHCTRLPTNSLSGPRSLLVLICKEIIHENGRDSEFCPSEELETKLADTRQD